MTDREIVLRAKTGDIAAFTELVRKYSNAVYGVAYSKLRDYHEAQDVAQEVFVRAYTNLHQLKAPEKIGSWLYSIASRLSLRMNIRRQVHLPLDERQLGKAYLADSDIHVREALGKLSEVNRQTLVLYCLAGYNTREIAGFIGVSVDAVEKRLRRARDSMRREMLDMVEENLTGNRLSPEFYRRLERTFRLWEANEKDEDYQEALKLFGLALDEKPNDPELLFQYGFLHQRRGARLLGTDQSAEGISLLRKAVSIYEKGLENGGTYYNQLLMAKSALGEAAEMIEEFKGKHLDNPADIRWIGLLALSYLYYTGDTHLDEAERYIRLAMEQNPNDFELFILMGDLNERLGASDDAILWWDKALRMNEEKAIPARFSKAEHFEKLGMIEDALKEWDQIKEFHIRYHYEEYVDWVDRDIVRLQGKLATHK
jgi:RNA polymerase sigma factor (sigma-70 family)